MQTLDFDYLPIRSSDVVLDLGCGEGRHAIALASQSQAQVVAADLSMESLGVANKRWDEMRYVADESLPGNVSCCAVDVYALPFAENSFDVVIFSEVMEHLTDYPRSIQEVRRVLRPGGLLGVSVPKLWPERLCWLLSSEYSAELGGHIRIFRRKDLLKFMEAQDFACYHKHSAHALHSPLWWLKCLFWRRRDTALSIRLMHRLLVCQIMGRPTWLARLLNRVERLLNPICGKSDVLYFYQGKT